MPGDPEGVEEEVMLGIEGEMVQLESSIPRKIPGLGRSRHYSQEPPCIGGPPHSTPAP
jgi:hypothetical protein